MNDISPPHKLVIVLQDLEFGGTQRYAINLLQYIDRSLFDPELWVLRGGMDMAPLAREAGVQIRWFSKSSWVTPIALYRFLLCLVCNKPTFLYPLTVVPNIWARIFGRLSGISYIISSNRGLHSKQWERILWPLSIHTICNAEAIKEKLIAVHRVPANRISVVANGVDSDLFSPIPEKKTPYPVLLFSGRLETVKDPLTAIKVFQLVHEEIPSATMVLAGNGKLTSELIQFVRQHSLEECITFLPGTIDVKRLLQESWVLLLSSLSEGSPNILIEAMSCGLPVVATKVGGISEIIEHGVNGYVVPPGNLTKFVESAILLLNDERLRIRVGQNARSTILRNHNLQDCVYQTERILLDQLKKRQEMPSEE